MENIKVLHDQHIHTEYSADSKEKLESYFQKAAELGCKYIVNTDHVDFDMIHYKSSWIVNFESLKKELSNLYKKYPSINPLLGIEIGYKKENIKEINEVLSSEDFDLINLSVHEVKDIDFYMSSYFDKYGIEKTLNIYFDAVIDATEVMDNYDVLCHVDYGFKTAYLMNQEVKISDYELKLKQIFSNIIKKDKALEINTKVQDVLNDEHLIYMLKLYKNLGGKNLTLSSDAHDVNRYKSSFDYYASIIKKCGFKHLVYFVKRQKYIYEL